MERPAHRRIHRHRGVRRGQGEHDAAEARSPLDTLEARCRLLAERSRDVVYRVRLDPGPVLEYVSPAATELTGYTPEEFYATPGLWQALVHPADRERVMVGRSRAAIEAPTVLRWVRRDGAVRWTEHQRVPVFDDDGTLVAIEGSARDVTHVHDLEAERALLAEAVAQTAESVIVTEPSGAIVLVNPAFERVTGYRREDVIGQNPRLLQAPDADPSTFVEMWAALGTGRTWQGEVRNRRRDGTPYTDSVTISPVLGPEGDLVAYISVQRDISHLLQVEAELVLEARVRALLGEAVQIAEATATLEAAAQGLCDGLAALPGIDFALLLAILDDGELRVVASRADDGFPAAFPLTPGTRLADDAAAYLLSHADTAWGQRLDEIPASTAIGVAARTAGVRALAFGPIRHLDHTDGVLIVGTRDPGSVAVVADTMPPLVAFGASSNAPLVERLDGRRRELATRSSISAAIAQASFGPVFQPIVDLASGTHVGYEALTRFTDGERPDRWFAEAWSVGLGRELEFATLAAAIAAAHELPAGRSLHINVSPRLLDHAESLRDLLRRSDRPLVLEITEHDTIDDYDQLRQAVRSLGHDVRLAVDDAGVGIANFGHIIELRPDLVKLDQSLVRRVNANLGRQALVVAMRHFARAAGCRIVAEGIENDDERRTLEQLGVDYGQGFALGFPESARHWSVDEAGDLAG